MKKLQKGDSFYFPAGSVVYFVVARRLNGDIFYRSNNYKYYQVSPKGMVKLVKQGL